jgi:uncharacterized membrane protein
VPIDPAILKNVPIFQLCDDDELKELAGNLEAKSYVSGQTIFKAGEAGGEMHVVLGGKVETFVIDEDGHRVVLAEVTPGEIFGELSLLDREPRSASTVAVAPTQTCVIDRDDLLALFTKKPHAALDVLAVLSQRLRATDRILQQRAMRNPNVVIAETASFGDRISDGVARFGGSWGFINSFTLVIVGWIVLNLYFLTQPFDPAPFIGLNLILSMLAAVQAPIIMMSQNRQDAKDRVRSELDYQVNVRAEVEIVEMHRKLDRMQAELMELLIPMSSDRRP